MTHQSLLLASFLLSILASPVLTFSTCGRTKGCLAITERIHDTNLALQAENKNSNNEQDTARRRSLFAVTGALLASTTTFLAPPQALAAQREPLDQLLYRILRVREATLQETRLIKSGKFKDVQRANVKLAVRFMIENYRLNDAFVGASSYLDSSGNKRVEAGQIGQATVQNLYTILEYFDSSDVENIKVGGMGMAGKEELVLRGMDATRKGIDDFLAFFPSSEVEPVQNTIEEENKLNEKEFDPNLGQIVNLPTKRS